ncbi:hypothetical protein IGJ41_002729 [Enterococcus sp. DIV1537a]|uniref:hypothetical protein n=1 Tax=Enterococcus sp. DIV1537a TaxID=2774733 RepID=UPI003F217066
MNIKIIGVVALCVMSLGLNSSSVFADENKEKQVGKSKITYEAEIGPEPWALSVPATVKLEPKNEGYQATGTLGITKVDGSGDYIDPYFNHQFSIEYTPDLIGKGMPILHDNSITKAIDGNSGVSLDDLFPKFQDKYVEASYLNMFLSEQGKTLADGKNTFDAQQPVIIKTEKSGAVSPKFEIMFQSDLGNIISQEPVTKAASLETVISWSASNIVVE